MQRDERERWIEREERRATEGEGGMRKRKREKMD